MVDYTNIGGGGVGTVDLNIHIYYNPNPFPPKSMLYFGPSSLSFTSENIDSGDEGSYGV